MDTVPKLQTEEDVRAFIQTETAKQIAAWRENSDRIIRAKNSVWLLLLVVVFLEFYLINTMIESADQHTIAVNLPARMLQTNCPSRLVTS